MLAYGVENDSTGEYYGQPLFKDKGRGEEFLADLMKYNYTQLRLAYDRVIF